MGSRLNLRTLDLLCPSCHRRFVEPIVVRCCSNTICRACAEHVLANGLQCPQCEHRPRGRLEEWGARSNTLCDIVETAALNAESDEPISVYLGATESSRTVPNAAQCAPSARPPLIHRLRTHAPTHARLHARTRHTRTDMSARVQVHPDSARKPGTDRQSIVLDRRLLAASIRWDLPGWLLPWQRSRCRTARGSA